MQRETQPHSTMNELETKGAKVGHSKSCVVGWHKPFRHGWENRIYPRVFFLSLVGCAHPIPLEWIPICKNTLIALQQRVWVIGNGLAFGGGDFVTEG